MCVGGLGNRCRLTKKKRYMIKNQNFAKIKMSDYKGVL